MSVVHIDGKELLIFTIRKGKARGGDYHKSVQHDIVVDGKIKLTYNTKNGERSKIVGTGESFTLEAGEEHYFLALDDCVMVEFLEGEFEKSYYEPYRKIVNELSGSS